MLIPCFRPNPKILNRKKQRLTHPRLGHTGERVCRPQELWKTIRKERRKRHRSQSWGRIKSRKLAHQLSLGAFEDPQLHRIPAAISALHQLLLAYDVPFETRGWHTRIGPFVFYPSLTRSGELIRVSPDSDLPELPVLRLKLGPAALRSTVRRSAERAGRLSRAARKRLPDEHNAHRLRKAQATLGDHWQDFVTCYEDQREGYTLRELRRIIRGWVFAAARHEDPALAPLSELNQDYCTGPVRATWNSEQGGRRIHKRPCCAYEDGEHCRLSGLDIQGGVTTSFCPRRPALHAWISEIGHGEARRQTQQQDHTLNSTGRAP